MVARCFFLGSLCTLYIFQSHNINILSGQLSQPGTYSTHAGVNGTLVVDNVFFKHCHVGEMKWERTWQGYNLVA